MNRKAVLLLLALAAVPLGVRAGRAQIIPGMGGSRPGNVVRPPGERGRATQRDTGGVPAQTRAQADSLEEALLKLQGYVPVYYQADSAEYRSDDRTLRLRGASRVERDGRVITARDSIVYMDRRDVVAAYGRPEGTPASGEGDPITGDVFYYNLNNRVANVRGARTKIAENATWYVAGDVTDERGERIYAQNSTFTSDDREDPAYHFKADRIMIIRNRILVGRPAYLYFKNVPVMALPFIVQDLEKGRRSGFLIPQFEINDIIRTRGGGGGSRGTGREISNIGYYWAINQYLGLQVAGRWRSQSYSAARGNLDFNFRRRFLTGSIEGEQFWEQDGGGGRLNLNGAARWQANERTDLALALGYASSTLFERERVIDIERQTADLSSTFSLTRQLDWGNLSLSAERRQSIANDDRTFSPHFSLNVNPFSPISGTTVNIGFNGQNTSQVFGNALERRSPANSTGNFSSSLSVSLGDFTVGGGGTYTRSSRSTLDSLPRAINDTLATPLDTLRLLPIPGRADERVSFNVSTGYQLNLFASTRVTPRIGFSRDLVRRDTTLNEGGVIPDSMRAAYGTFVAGPPRLDVGAALSTDLYGFFPGFGNYETIRHHIQPTIDWRYSPAARISDSTDARTQRMVFGENNARSINQITLGFTNTFEAKVRQSHPVRGDSAADSANAAGNRSAPAQSQKITLLAINTNALAYSFVPTDRFNTRFLTPDLSTTVRSDLLGGFQFTMSHSLFDQRLVAADSGRSELRRGSFNPFLTQFNTQFTLGQNSALFRWLGFSRGTEEERRPERGQTPDAAGVRPTSGIGSVNPTANNQQAGGGPWSLSLNYSLTRQRRSPADTLPGNFRGGNSQLGGTLSFQPTRNWAVSWGTEYSTTTGQFSAHRINLKRDLYRWQANFDYILSPNGNTGFSFSVHLIDLPDLKADYQERNLGVDRATTGPTSLPPPE